MNDIASRKAAIPLKKVLPPKRPSRADAEDAVRTLIAWAGDDPGREGLKDTPRRVTDAFEEYYSGYALDPAEVLSRQFEEAGGYDDLVMLRDIRVESHCEHHMAPFLGVATSPTCPTAASSASPRSPAWWRSSASACRRRRP